MQLMRNTPPRGAHRGAYRRCVADVADDHLQPLAMRVAQPLQIARDALAREVVEHAHRLPFTQQTMREIRSDESAAAGDERVLAFHTVSPRAASSADAWATLSTAICPSSHCASCK